jgi:hypothetical protein
MSHLPELGIGLSNNLYPTACSVVPTKAAPVAPLAFAQLPVAPPVDITAPLLHRIAVLQEHCGALQQKCSALEAAWSDKCAECLNYERKLFVLEAAAQQAAPQPVFFPFQGPGQVPRPPRVEVVDEAPQPVICAAFVIDSSLNDSCAIYEQEPDMSLSQAFALAMDDPFAAAVPIAAIPATVVPAAVTTPAAVTPAVVAPPAVVTPPAAVVSAPATSTTRRVHMGDLMAPAAVAAANAASARAPEAVAALAASVAAMSDKEVGKLSVESVAENLSVFGLVYTKPKAQAAKLLHATAKSFMASGTLP